MSAHGPDAFYKFVNVIKDSLSEARVSPTTVTCSTLSYDHASALSCLRARGTDDEWVD